MRICPEYNEPAKLVDVASLLGPVRYEKKKADKETESHYREKMAESEKKAKPSGERVPNANEKPKLADSFKLPSLAEVASDPLGARASADAVANHQQKMAEWDRVRRGLPRNPVAPGTPATPETEAALARAEQADAAKAPHVLAMPFVPGGPNMPRGGMPRPDLPSQARRAVGEQIAKAPTPESPVPLPKPAGKKININETLQAAEAKKAAAKEAGKKTVDVKPSEVTPEAHDLAQRSRLEDALSRQSSRDAAEKAAAKKAESSAAKNASEASGARQRLAENADPAHAGLTPEQVKALQQQKWRAEMAAAKRVEKGETGKSGLASWLDPWTGKGRAGLAVGTAGLGLAGTYLWNRAGKEVRNALPQPPNQAVDAPNRRPAPQQPQPVRQAQPGPVPAPAAPAPAPVPANPIPGQQVNPANPGNQMKPVKPVRPQPAQPRPRGKNDL